ncbi:MAG: hypothetical protein FJZ43_04980, partial [Candidatus Staskawiczbacteria bacterium]|nr:hypothetical protein [Candidatus Staskawiczbacteria bacterium]
MFSKNFLYPFVFLVIVLITFLTRTEINQSVGWTYPYCSGAANLDFSLKWEIDPNEYAVVSKMHQDEYRSHRHIVSENPIIYEYNNFGYVLIVFIARNLFFWMGDLNSVILLQILVHAFISISIIKRLNSKLLAPLFLFLYAVNPFVSHFVTFPFYYFWAVIPSYIFLLLFFRKKSFTYELFYLLPLLYFAYIIRPTTILIIFFFLFYQIILDKSKFRLSALSSLIVFSALAFLLSSTPSTLGRRGQQSTIWHTAYIGLGAYPNKYGIQLSDEFAFTKYHKETGIGMSSNP